MEIALLVINTLLLAAILTILLVLVSRLQRAKRAFELRQEEFERNLETLSQITTALDAFMRRLDDLRDKTQLAGELGRALGRFRKR
ncbi:MAG: hypothetical protein Kow00129_05250 [Thermoleophilia bacterium]